MYIKSLISILIVTSSFILAFGQDTPEPVKPPEPRATSWYFDGSGSYLGVQTTEVNKENFSKYGLRDVRGVAVEKVVENSPAAAAGLQAGDVIVRFNGEEVTSARKLTRLIGEIDPDHQAKVTVIRNGTERELTATLAKHPAMKFENGNFNFPNIEMPSIPNLKGLEKLKDLPQLKDFPQGDSKVWTFPGGEGKSYILRAGEVGSSRVDLQACKLEYSIVSPK